MIVSIYRLYWSHSEEELYVKILNKRFLKILGRTDGQFVDLTASLKWHGTPADIYADKSTL